MRIWSLYVLLACVHFADIHWLKVTKHWASDLRLDVQ